MILVLLLSTGLYPLDAECFMSAEATFAILLAQPIKQKVFPLIPTGGKSNVFCVVDNRVNTMRAQGGRRRAFEDDCGAYNSKDQKRVSAHYWRTSPGRFQKVYVQNGVYQKEQQVDGKVRRVPYEHQPPSNDVFVLVRTYWTLQSNANYRKRVSYLEQPHRFQDVFVAEYLGKWMPPAGHGNSRTSITTGYRRTQQSVLESIAHSHRGKSLSNYVENGMN